MRKQRVLAALAAILFVTACKQAPAPTDPVTDPGTDPVTDPVTDPATDPGTDDPVTDPVVDPDRPALDFDVVLRDFSPTQEEKMMESLRRARTVLNSQEFKDRVLNFTWNGVKRFNDNNGQTNEEIYETIMKGAETLLPDVDYEMDLDITLYYSLTSTVGYTYPNTIQIWVNSKFFNGYNYGQVAANAVHEWTHKLGYGHDYNYNSDRPYSVPYGIGGIINDLVNKL